MNEIEPATEILNSNLFPVTSVYHDAHIFF